MSVQHAFAVTCIAFGLGLPFTAWVMQGTRTENDEDMRFVVGLLLGAGIAFVAMGLAALIAEP